MHLSSTRKGYKLMRIYIPELGFSSQDFGSKYHNLYSTTPCLMRPIFRTPFNGRYRQVWLYIQLSSFTKFLECNIFTNHVFPVRFFVLHFRQAVNQMTKFVSEYFMAFPFPTKNIIINPRTISAMFGFIWPSDFEKKFQDSSRYEKTHKVMTIIWQVRKP